MIIVRSNLLCEPKISQEEFNSIKEKDFVDKILAAAGEFYDRKEELLGSEFMARLEQVAVLQTIDDK